MPFIPSRLSAERRPLAGRVVTPATGATLGLGIALFLSGCGAGVEAPDVASTMPNRFAEAEATRGGALSTDWVARFGSRDLTRLIARADLDNLDLAAARARIVQAEGQLTATRAGLMPTVSGSGDATRTATPGTTSSATPPFRTRFSNSFQLGGSASWQLDLWGATRASVVSSEASLDASRIDVEAVRLSTATAIADAYVQVAAAEDRLRLARENAVIAERTLGAIRRRFDVGTVTALDLAQQEGVLATQRAAVPNLEITLRQTRNALIVLTGRPPESETVVTGGLGQLKLPTIGAGVPSSLLTRRPDVAEAEMRLSAAAANVEAARRAFLPQVSLTGSGGFASAFLKNLLRPDALAGSIGASVTDPIFDGGLRDGNLTVARGQHAELAADYRKTVIQALADVENALVAVEQNRRLETLQAAVVASARRTQKLTEQQLTEGTIPITTVLDAERTLFSAEDTQVTVRLARFEAAISLVAALGGGWDKSDTVKIETASAPAGGPDGTP